MRPIEKLRAATAKKLETLEGQLRTAEGQLAKEKAESNAAKMQAGVSVLGGILGGLFGRKAGLGSITRGSSAIGKATSAYKQHQDVANADAKIAGITEEIEAIQAELEAEIAKITASYDPAALTLETESLKPDQDRTSKSNPSPCSGFPAMPGASGRGKPRNPLALRRGALQIAAHQGGLAELVDALDSKSSSNECGFESHSRYFLFSAGLPDFP